MPPHKPVKTLFTLALDVTRKSVLSACMNLDVKFPCASDSIDAFSANGCRAAIQELQDYLLAAPRVWDSLFNSVMDLHQPSHIGLQVEMFILATFIYNKVSLTKLQVSPIDVENIHTRRYFEFWMEQAPKLENLVELYLGNVRPECEDIVYAFGRSCKHLKILELPHGVSDAAADFMFASCKELRVLNDSHYAEFTKRALEVCKNLEHYIGLDSDLLLEFDRNHRFKLKSITLEGSPQQVKEHLEKCPELQEIHLYYTESDVLNVVAGSEVKLLKLTLDCFSIKFDALAQLLTSKGDLFTELTIYYCEMSRPLQMMQLIGENCPNLAFLYLSDVDDSWSTHPDLPGTVTNMSYPNLQHLAITVCGNVSRFSPSCLCFMNQCIASAKSLLSFAVDVFVDESFESGNCFLNNWFIELFSTNRGVIHLQKVNLKTFSGSDDWGFISKQLTELIIERCPKLTELHIDNITVEAASYLDGLRDESQVKNLDIAIDYSLHGQE